MTEKKKKIFDIVFTCVFSICVLICLTVITFSWLPRENKKAYRALYKQDLIISSLDLDITFQVYNTETLSYLDIAKYEGGTLVPIKQPDDSMVANINYAVKSIKLNPGDKQSYRFVIKNNSLTSDVTCNVELTGFYQKDANLQKLANQPTNDLFDKLSIFISSPNVYEVNTVRYFMKETGEETADTSKSLDLDFYNNLTVPKGQTVNLDWYIELSTNAGNEFQGYSFGFDSIFFRV